MDDNISLEVNAKEGTLKFQGPPKALGEALQHIEKFMKQQSSPQRLTAVVLPRTPVAQIDMFPAESSDSADSTKGDASASTIAQPNPAQKPKSKKTKASFVFDKTLNLNPPGKKSAADFVREKNPTNGQTKCLAAVYYLRQVLELPQVTTDLVYTFFKIMVWPVPADLKNKLQQAGSAGWLDTADGNNIKLTPSGENEIEFNMKAAEKPAQ